MIQAETLQLLEWPRLCQHLSTFAATKLGAIAATHLPIPNTLEESQTLLAQTQEADELECRAPSGLKFDGIWDIGDSLERAELQGLLSAEELLAIATTLAGVRQLRRLIDQHPDLTVLGALVADLRTYPDIEQEIHHCIDDRGQVSERASPQLGEIRQRQRHLRDRIYQTLNNLLQRHSQAIQESLITQRSDRFVLPLKSSHKDIIPGIVHDTSTSGATLYVEPYAIVDTGNQLRQANRQEKAEEEKILRLLTERVAAVKPDLEHLLAIATILDLSIARARYSRWLKASPPQFIDRQAGQSMILRHLRHPLLIWQHHHEQGPEVVPIDLIIPASIRVVTITGPNTGGKTVTLKTLGLVSLMAKVGLYIPAQDPVAVYWFDQLLADIGDEQSLQQNLSTFSGHIRRISRVLEALTEQSLVLLDEVGAGTDPSEGSALAIALLHHLADSAQLTIATTHFGELKALKYQNDRFENASVEFDDVSLAPTYRLLWGIPGRSNALAIAQRLGLPASITTQAQELVGPGATADINQVIAGLENQRRQQEQKAAEANRLLKHAERLHNEIAHRAADLEAREQRLQHQQEEAIQQAIAQAQTEIAHVIRQLQQQGEPTAHHARQATETLQTLADKHLPSRQTSPQKTAKPKAKPTFRPQVGDRIRIPQIGQTADVIAGPTPDGELTVRMGLMKMTVTLEAIESLNGEKAQPLPKPKSAPAPPPPPPPPPTPAIRTPENTLDLRGSRVVDAEILLDGAIAQAQGPLWIIHGHGTGRLRRGVQEYLRQHPRISHCEPAEPADGGNGVTIAHLCPS